VSRRAAGGRIWPQYGTTPAWLHEVASPAAAPAAGGDVTIELDGVDADQLLVIRADKVHHWLGPDGSERSATSSVELLLAGIVVVEPDPGVPLTLWVPMGPDGPLGRVELAGGTPGVFYQLQRSQTGDELGGPAYFHQLLEVGASTAKGIDRLGVEVDLVVSRPAADRQAGPGTGSPAGVLIDAELPLDRVIRVRATRATTGASTLLSGTVTLRSMPTIRLSPAVVERGAPVEVEILLSRKAERYQVLLDGTPLGPAQDGSGAKLVVATPPLDADADIEVIVTQPGSDGLALTRSVHLAVAVSPA
jgi:hypothetical protein